MSGGISSVQHVFQQLCALLATSINTLLIQLILHKSPKSLGVYKYLMIYISLFEILYAVIDVLAAADFYSYDTMFVVLVRTDKALLPAWTLTVLDNLLCSLFGVSMAVFAIHFVYRYLVVSGSSFLKSISFVKLCIWFLAPVLYGIIWSSIVTSTLDSNKFTDDILRKRYLPKHGISIENVTYFGINYYMLGKDGKEDLNWKVMAGMAVIMTMVSVSISTMILFATLSYRKMGVLVDASSNSKHYRSLQLELLNSLVVQALIPILLMQGPSSIIFTAPFFHQGSELLGGILGITIALYPVLDPLPTMFIIKHYRNALLRPFRRREKKHATKSSIPVVSTYV